MKIMDSSSGAIAIGALFFLLLPFVAYPGCYYYSGRRTNYGVTNDTARTFEYRWQAAAFIPAAKAESLATGRPVHLFWLERVPRDRTFVSGKKMTELK
jgi:hypothetical protein